MKKPLLIKAIVAFSLFLPTAHAQSLSKENSVIQDEIIIQLKPKLSKGQFNGVRTRLGQSLSVARVDSLKSKRQKFVRIKLKRGVDLYKAMADCRLDNDVHQVYHNHKVELYGNPPNDPDFARHQWNLHNTGQTGGLPGKDINVLKAWELETGSQDIIVAVIDSGIDYNHEDLRDNMWRNDAEYFGSRGVDDDNNGYVDDIYGYDFYNRRGDPMDVDGHGTHVAGIIGAEGNNGIGITGVTQKVRLMALKFIEHNNGSTWDAIDAIYYALDQGAHVINNSWGGLLPSFPLEQAIQDVANANRLFVAAAGNHDFDIVVFPAAYANVLAVGGTDNSDQRYVLSNHGSYVDVSAPGFEIYSTLPNNRYGYLSGTSMASPHVAGLAALLLSNDPTLTRDELDNILRFSGDALPIQESIGNRINAEAALKFERPVPLVQLEIEPWKDRPMGAISGRAWVPNFSKYTLYHSPLADPQTWLEIASSFVSVEDGNILHPYDYSQFGNQNHSLRLVVEDTNGRSYEAKAAWEYRDKGTPPTVNAGPDQVITWPQNSFELNGTVHDDGLPNPPGFFITTWFPAPNNPYPVEIDDRNALQAQVTFPQPGTYRLLLVADDQGPVKGEDVIEIKVLPDPNGNIPPVANAGPDRELETVNGVIEINLDGTQSYDLDGEIVHYRWTQADVADPIGEEAVVMVQLTRGLHRFFLTVTDNNGDTHQDDVAFLVFEGREGDGPNQPPVVDAGDDHVLTSDSRAFINGSVTDDGLPLDPGELTIMWSVKSSSPVAGSSVTFTNNGAEDVIATFFAPGIYVLELSATDGEFTVLDTVTIEVLPSAFTARNTKPIVHVFVESVSLEVEFPYTAHLIGVVEDDGLPNPPGEVTSEWFIEISDPFPPDAVIADPHSLETTITFNQPGFYSVVLGASDSELFHSDGVSFSLTAKETAPTPTRNGIVKAGSSNMIQPSQNKFATINYELNTPGSCRVKVYNQKGRLVREMETVHESMGYYSLSFDGRSSTGNKLGSGIYYAFLYLGEALIEKFNFVIRN